MVRLGAVYVLIAAMGLLSAPTGSATAADPMLDQSSYKVTFDKNPVVAGSRFLSVRKKPVDGALATNVIRVNFDPTYGTRLCVRLVTGDAILQVAGEFDMTGVAAGTAQLLLPLEKAAKRFLSERQAGAVGIEVTYSSVCPPQWQQTGSPLFAVASLTADQSTGPVEFVFQAINTTPLIVFDAPGVAGSCGPSKAPEKVAFDSICSVRLPAGGPIAGTISFTDIFGSKGEPLPFQVFFN